MDLSNDNYSKPFFTNMKSDVSHSISRGDDWMEMSRSFGGIISFYN